MDLLTVLVSTYVGAAGCFVHTGIDLLTHDGDGPLLLFRFEWSYRVMSPASYWDPHRFGRAATLPETALDLALLGYLGRAWRASDSARRAEAPADPMDEAARGVLHRTHDSSSRVAGSTQHVALGT